MTNELFVELSGPAADARASAEIVAVTREFVASQTEGWCFHVMQHQNWGGRHGIDAF